jgi:hypothetical protein
MHATRQGFAQRAYSRIHSVREPVRSPFGDHFVLGHATVQVHSEGALLQTEMFLPESAVPTHAAIAVGFHRDEVAFPNASHSVSNRVNKPRHLMPQSQRRTTVIGSVKDVLVGATDADGHRLDTNLTRSRVRSRDIFEPEIMRSVEA